MRNSYSSLRLGSLLNTVITTVMFFQREALSQALPPLPFPTSEIQVDGSISPQLIPDDVAYVHLFHILMKNPNSKNTIADELRRQSYSHHYFSLACGATNRTLTTAQIDKLLALVDRTTGEYLATHSRMVASKSQAEYDAAGRALQALAVKTFNSLDPIDFDLSAKVRAHVKEHVKSRMKIMSAKVPQGKT